MLLLDLPDDVVAELAACDEWLSSLIVTFVDTWDSIPGSSPDATSPKKVFHNDLRRRQQRIAQASVRKAVWISGRRS